jgi:uncharacterized protein YukE
MFDFLVRMARSVVDNVLSQLLQQKNVVLEQAMRPMEAMVQQVLGGIWIGKGADAFVQEVRSIMVPGVRTIDTNLGTFSRNIQFARERIDRADSDVAKLVKSKLADKFKFF